MHRSLKTAVAVSALLLLAGCDMATPSQVSVRPIEIRKTVKTETVDALRTDMSRAQVISDSYARNSGGPMSITVSVLKGNAKQAAAAKKGAAAWRALFLKDGVPDVTVDAVAVEDPAYAGQAVVAWPAKVASAPKECGRLPGYQGAEPLSYTEKYAFGCETESALAHQIANPSDLMGRGGVPGDDAKRQGTLVDKYRSGTPNPKLNGVSASGTSGGSGG
jgi:pilus biogenesis lipoprotein CpaD